MTSPASDYMREMGIDREVAFILSKMIYDIRDICTDRNIASQLARLQMAPSPDPEEIRSRIAGLVLLAASHLRAMELNSERNARRRIARKQVYRASTSAL